MNSDSVFIKRVDTLLKWRKRKRVLSFLVWSLALSLILNSFALGLQKVFHSLWDGISIYLVLTLVSLGVILLCHHLTKKDFLSDLIEIDSRLQLKDRLSTAFELEYRPSGRKSRFRESLLMDAGGVLEGLPKNRLYPPGFSPAYVLIPLFAFVILVLLLFDFSLTDPKEKNTQERLARLGAVMEKFSKEKIRETRELDDHSFGEPYRQLEELAKDLQSRSLKQERLLSALGEMKKGALAERLHLTRKLEKELNAGGSPGGGNPYPLPKEITTPKDLEKMTEQLRDLFDGHPPESIMKDISRIREKFHLEQFLEETRDLAVSPGPFNDQQALLSKRQGGYPGEGENQKELEKQPSWENMVPLSPEKEQSKVPMSPKAGQWMEGSQKTGKKDQRQEGDEISTAGRERGTEEKFAPFELKRGRGPSFKEGGNSSGTEPSPSVQARSLPLFGKTKDDREETLQEIPASYRKELEAVLHKEKIPREYREYIKQYFLSIRQEKGKKQDDKTQRKSGYDQKKPGTDPNRTF